MDSYGFCDRVRGALGQLARRIFQAPTKRSVLICFTAILWVIFVYLQPTLIVVVNVGNADLAAPCQCSAWGRGILELFENACAAPTTRPQAAHFIQCLNLL